eukprot:TRINITY_DN8911_c0_g1::TRINITY_DN8911_c0_g1_i1::g.18939::m.18939 TRINITY_DN8911_c0_g1::TRINITY_DN8911_c0_g1_i1::g.18939  ORF type:complete len:213 (+),score=21.25 TRINITY_DN8911_c0_g1_i1:54-692(+)
MVIYEPDRVTEYHLKQKDACWQFHCTREEQELAGFQPPPKSMESEKAPPPSHLIDARGENGEPPLYIPLSHVITIPGFGHNSLPDSQGSSHKPQETNLFRKTKIHNPRPVLFKNQGNLNDRTSILGQKELRDPSIKETATIYINPSAMASGANPGGDPHSQSHTGGDMRVPGQPGKTGVTPTHYGGYVDDHHEQHISCRGFKRAPGGLYWPS